MGTAKYGAVYKRVRARLMRQYRPGVSRCWRCGKPISDDPSRVHLGHSDDGKRFMGLEHISCNQRGRALEQARLARIGRLVEQTGQLPSPAAARPAAQADQAADPPDARYWPPGNTIDQGRRRKW